MTKDTLDYKQLMGAGLTQDISKEGVPPEQGQLVETVPHMPVETDDEEALEEYMNSMLERLTGSKREASVTQPLPAIDAAVEATPVEAESPVRETVRPSDLREDLTGMRELANQTVESALVTHSSGRLVPRIKATLALAIGCSLTSSLLVILALDSKSSWTYPAAVATMGAAFLTSLRYFGLSRRLANINRQLEVGSE